MIKRTNDIIFSLSMLIGLSPLLLLISICIWLSDLHNPIFIQQRYGQNGSKFNLIKFRTMKVIQNGEQRTIIDLLEDGRVTNTGKLLRASHLDELPQLVNILNGDMSIVGPRPIPCDMQVMNIPNWQVRSLVKPGLTGLAQVHCTKYTGLRNKFRLDALYVRSASLWLDIKLVFATAYRIRSLIAFVLWTMVILLATMLPISENVINSIAPIPYIDKIGHFTMFLVMMVIAYWFAKSFTSRMRTSLAFGIVWCIGLSAFTEIAQHYIPLRNMSVLDFIADFGGMLIGELMIYGSHIQDKKNITEAG